MFPPLDIFKTDGSEVLWRDAAANLGDAKTRIRRLALSSPGGYCIFDQRRGQRTFVTQVPDSHFSNTTIVPSATIPATMVASQFVIRTHP